LLKGDLLKIVIKGVFDCLNQGSYKIEKLDAGSLEP